MKQKPNFMCKGRHWLMAGAVLASCGMGVVSCDKYDLDKTSPDSWGASIYNYLSDGNYTNISRMIDELGEREVLDKTGSKTFFAANDEAFERFYANNPWGVRRYEDLTLAQKAMIVRGAMINNSYQVQTLSSVAGDGEPVEGVCMRRVSALSVYDTVAVMKTQDMPENPYWTRYRNLGSIACMKDMTTPPMIHFIEKLLENNRITNEDVNFLYNHGISRKAGDASVNGVQIVDPNIRCSNGFVHQVNDVLMPLNNMAEVLNTMPEASIYNRLLRRFCAPYYCGDDATKNYNAYMTSQGRPTVDSLFQLRFFSLKSQNGAALDRNPNKGVVPAQLNFDPGWNEYFFSTAVSQDIALQRDMAVMMVPSDEAMNKYWNAEGSMLRDRYGSWDNVPDDVIIDLLNNNLQPSFVSTVPSKFGNILNDANDPLGIKAEDVKSVRLGCNGAIYLLDKVFSPTRYVSVLYPALVNEALKIMDYAVQYCKFDVYLNSLNSTFSFFIPSNNAMLEYIDPVSFGETVTQLYRFHIDPDQPLESRVWAEVYEYDLLTRQVVGEPIGEVRDMYTIKNRLREVLNNHIVLSAIDESTNEPRYYRTKGGMEILVKNAASGEAGMTVEGSFQLAEGAGRGPIQISKVYSQKNGKAYVLDSEPIMGTTKSVFDVLMEYPEFSEFATLLYASGILESIRKSGTGEYKFASESMSVFNNFHYTVYVPDNASIQALWARGYFPDLDELEQREQFLEDLKEELGPKYAEKEEYIQALDALNQFKKPLVDFVKYHVQDNSLFINSAMESKDYETALYDTKTKTFKRLNVTVGANGESITVEDAKKQKHEVDTSAGLYNIQAKEYMKQGNTLSSVSTAVIHSIKGALMPD